MVDDENQRLGVAVPDKEGLNGDRPRRAGVGRSHSRPRPHHVTRLVQAVLIGVGLLAILGTVLLVLAPGRRT